MFSLDDVLSSLFDSQIFLTSIFNLLAFLTILSFWAYLVSMCCFFLSHFAGCIFGSFGGRFVGVRILFVTSAS